MKKLFIPLFLLTFVLTAIAPEGGTWISMEYPEHGFKAKFPSGVQESSEQKDYGVTFKFMSQPNPDMVYFASVTELDTDVSGVEGLEKEAMQSFVNSMEAKVTGGKGWKVSGIEGRRVTMTSEANDVYAEYGVLFRGHYMYQVVGAGKRAGYDSKTVKKFFKGFKLLK